LFSTEQNSQVGGFGPKFGQNLNVKNIRQFFCNTKKPNTKKIELEKLVNLRYF
jgi:hypothetical protein